MTHDLDRVHLTHDLELTRVNPDELIPGRASGSERVKGYRVNPNPNLDRVNPDDLESASLLSHHSLDSASLVHFTNNNSNNNNNDNNDTNNNNNNNNYNYNYYNNNTTNNNNTTTTTNNNNTNTNTNTNNNNTNNTNNNTNNTNYTNNYNKNDTTSAADEQFGSRPSSLPPPRHATWTRIPRIGGASALRAFNSWQVIEPLCRYE